MATTITPPVSSHDSYPDDIDPIIGFPDIDRSGDRKYPLLPGTDIVSDGHDHPEYDADIEAEKAELLHNLSTSRDKYIREVIRQSKGYLHNEKSQNRLRRARQQYDGILNEILENNPELVYELADDDPETDDVYFITDDISLEGALQLFLAGERKIIEQARIDDMVGTRYKELKKKTIEKYQSLGRLKKIAVGIGTGALIGSGIGLVVGGAGAAAATGFATIASRAARGYASSKRYRGGAAEIAAESFFDDINSSDTDNTQEWRNSLFEDVERGVAIDKKANRRALYGAAGSVMLGSAIGWGLRELGLFGGHGEAASPGGGSEVPDSTPDGSSGSLPHFSMDRAHEFLRSWQAEHTPAGGGQSHDVFDSWDGRSAKIPYKEYPGLSLVDTGSSSDIEAFDIDHHALLDSAPHGDGSDLADNPLGNDLVEPADQVDIGEPLRQFTDWTDTVDKGEGFTYVMRDLFEKEGLPKLKPSQLYEIYKAHEPEFAAHYLSTGEAYHMGSGDLGISHTGEITIPAELRKGLVVDAYKALGLNPEDALHEHASIDTALGGAHEAAQNAGDIIGSHDTAIDVADHNVSADGGVDAPHLDTATHNDALTDTNIENQHISGGGRTLAEIDTMDQMSTADHTGTLSAENSDTVASGTSNSSDSVLRNDAASGSAESLSDNAQPGTTLDAGSENLTPDPTETVVDSPSDWEFEADAGREIQTLRSALDRGTIPMSPERMANELVVGQANANQLIDEALNRLSEDIGEQVTNAGNGLFKIVGEDGSSRVLGSEMFDLCRNILDIAEQNLHLQVR